MTTHRQGSTVKTRPEENAEQPHSTTGKSKNIKTKRKKLILYSKKTMKRKGVSNIIPVGISLVIALFIGVAITQLTAGLELTPDNYEVAASDEQVSNQYVTPVNPVDGQILEYDNRSEEFTYKYKVDTEKLEEDYPNATMFRISSANMRQNDGESGEQSDPAAFEEFNGLGLSPSFNSTTETDSLENGTHTFEIPTRTVDDLLGNQEVIDPPYNWSDGHFSTYFYLLEADSNGSTMGVLEEPEEVRWQIRETGDYTDNYLLANSGLPIALFLIIALGSAATVLSREL